MNSIARFRETVSRSANKRLQRTVRLILCRLPFLPLHHPHSATHVSARYCKWQEAAGAINNCPVVEVCVKLGYQTALVCDKAAKVVCITGMYRIQDDVTNLLLGQ